MSSTWTKTQHTRLIELGADQRTLAMEFPDKAEQTAQFQKLSCRLVAEQKQRLTVLRCETRRPALRLLEDSLISALTDAGFVEIATPLITTKGLLAKMSITADDPLYKQVYWLDGNRCMRPMLAPHLYYVMKDLLRLWPKPVRIFEVGPCFRKESDGARHAAEFTMLNLCEFGLPAEQRARRLNELAALVMATVGMADYDIAPKQSKVYNTTLDVIHSSTGLELASGAMGPHELDKRWGITDTWVGLGFGLERLLMARADSRNLARFGRSISYLDGARLNI